MQLIDLVRGRWLVVLGIPLVAAAVAGLATYRLTDRQMTASARVDITQILPKDASSFQIVPVIEDFRATFLSDEVAAGVSEQTHLPRAEIVGKFAATASEYGLAVSFTAAAAEGARAGLQAGVRLTFVSLVEQARSRAQIEVSAAEAGVDRTGAALVRLQEQAKVRDPPVEYAQRLTDLLNLRNQSAQANAAGQAQLQPLIDKKAVELDQIGAALPSAVQLETASKLASERLVEAQQAVALAAARLDAINAEGPALRSVSTTPTSRKGVLVQAVVGAAMLSGAIVLLVLWRRMWTGRMAMPEKLEPMAGHGDGDASDGFRPPRAQSWLAD